VKADRKRRGQNSIKGYNAGIPTDGNYNEDTASAVRTFQLNHTLNASGVVDSVTWDRIRDARRQLPVILNDTMMAATRSLFYFIYFYYF
jgi:peptidoglycan hydrolase-like protein with peptidoglycan-binding domain